MMQHPQSRRLGRSLLAAAAGVLVVAVLAAPARAAGVTREANSLAIVPADAAYYATMLRNREQLDIFLRSKAWARLKDMPAVQMAWTFIKSQYSEDGKLAGLKQFYDQPENQELVALLADAFSEEVFVYGGANWVDFADLAVQVASALRFGPTVMQITGKTGGLNQTQLQGRAVLTTLSENQKLLQVPDLIVGFRLTDTKKAVAQFKRLESAVGPLLDQVPQLKGKLHRVKVGGESFLTLDLDGSMVPWDDIPFSNFEEKEGEFKPLIAKLKSLRLTVSLGLHDKYLLLAVGTSPDHVNRLGKGARLEGRPELKPLARYGNRRLTGIGYVSKALAARVGTSAGDIDGFVEMAKGLLEKADVAAARRKAIAKDLDELGGEVKKTIEPAGAKLAFEFLTERGYERYSYDYGSHPDVDSSKPLTLLEHVGGNPILAVVGRAKDAAGAYRFFSKWVRRAYSHVDAILEDKLDKEQKEKYQQARKELVPLFQKLDEVTAKMLLPALADGQTAFVLDAKWKSKQWFQAMPAGDKPLPLPEVEIVCGVSDADLLRKAMTSYREIANKAFVAVRELEPDRVPEIKIPPARTRKTKFGTLYFYTLPEEWNVDAQVALTVGLSDSVVVLAPSHGGAERCLASRPLAIRSGPLADPKRPLARALYFNWPELVDALDPWIEFAVGLAPIPDAPGLGKDDILRQVRTFLSVLKCFRGSTSATYLEGGTLVTHSESVFHDL